MNENIVQRNFPTQKKNLANEINVNYGNHPKISSIHCHKQQFKNCNTIFSDECL